MDVLILHRLQQGGDVSCLQTVVMSEHADLTCSPSLMASSSRLTPTILPRTPEPLQLRSVKCRKGLNIGLTRNFQAFYEPNKDRPNFTVLTSAQAQRVLFKKTASGDLTANGVEFISEGTRYIVKATRDVIVSAG